jgi:hypothetical protein
VIGPRISISLNSPFDFLPSSSGFLLAVSRPRGSMCVVLRVRQLFSIFENARTEITFTYLIIAGMQSCFLRRTVENSICWDITYYSPLKFNRFFGALPVTFFVVFPCLAYTSTINIVPPKSRLTFNRLHGVISQIIELYTSSAVTISTIHRYIIVGGNISCIYRHH